MASPSSRSGMTRRNPRVDIPEMLENRNFILAIALSIAVLVGWQYFVAGPQIERARQQAIEAEQQQQQQPTAAPDTATPAPGDAAVPSATEAPAPTPAATVLTRDAALQQSPRIPIDTARLSGSINLKGGRLDDLHLKDFHETVD